MNAADNLDRQTDRISVIVPVYNTASFLPKCVESILKQTYQNIEIILIDDGSTDGSSEICDEYAASFDYVKVIHQENAGVSTARNTGIEHATGEYISFVDSDDWLHCRLLERLYTGIYETGAQICIAEGKICWQNDNNTDNLCIDDADFEILNRESLVNIHAIKSYVWGRLYDCHTINKIRFKENLTFAEDRMFNLNVFCSHDDLRVAYTHEQLYYYFQRPDSAVHTTISPTKFFELGECCFDLVDEMPSSWGKSTMLMEAIKDFLSARYGMMFRNDQESKECINKAIKKVLPYVIREREVSLKTRLIYLIFSLIPFSYRVFRIAADPTMRQWEKREKMMQN